MKPTVIENSEATSATSGIPTFTDDENPELIDDSSDSYVCKRDKTFELD